MRKKTESEQRNAEETIEGTLGYRFSNPQYLRRALTHRSYANEYSGKNSDNERLEFLGDALIGLAVASQLWHAHHSANEGDLSRRRSTLVCEASLAAIAVRLGIAEALRLGRGEARSGGRQKPRLLASAFEACMGAVLVDGGIGTAMSVLERIFAEEVAVNIEEHSDYKSELQERLHAQDRDAPRYQLAGTQGPEHAKIFIVEVISGKETLARAQGRSRTAAEQNTAKAALNRVKKSTRVKGR